MIGARKSAFGIRRSAFGDRQTGVANLRSPTSNRQRGFTLMEVLVTLAVFSTVSVALTDIYLLATRAERRIGTSERLSNDARSALEAIVRAVRTGSVAYDLMTEPLAVPLTSLTVRNQSGTIQSFSLSSDAVACAGSATPCLLIAEGAASAPLTPASVRVEDLKFFVSPALDPFRFDPATGLYAADAQPTVTIALSLIAASGGERTVLQTTVTSREYAR